ARCCRAPTSWRCCRRPRPSCARPSTSRSGSSTSRRWRARRPWWRRRPAASRRWSSTARPACWSRSSRRPTAPAPRWTQTGTSPTSPPLSRRSSPTRTALASWAEPAVSGRSRRSRGLPSPSARGRSTTRWSDPAAHLPTATEAQRGLGWCDRSFEGDDMTGATHDRHDLEAMVAKVQLFSALSHRQVRKLVDRAREVKHLPGQEVAAQGLGALAFHLVLEGHASVTLNGKEVRTLGPGEYFG